MKRTLLMEVEYDEPTDADVVCKAFNQSLQKIDFRHERLILMFVRETIKPIKQEESL